MSGAGIISSRTNEPLDALVAHIGVTFPSLSIDVSFSIGRGERIGLVGANGSGKTTILRAIAGLQPIDTGVVRINDRVVDDPSARILLAPQARRVAMVFQDYRLFPHLSAVDNVAFGLRQHGIHRRAAQTLAMAWLGRVGLIDHAHHRPAALSGGQAQRVALARALATEPDVLLLDEPLAAIDASSRATLRNEIAQHLGGFTGPTIVVSHQPDDIAALTTRIITVDRGRVLSAPDRPTEPPDRG